MTFEDEWNIKGAAYAKAIRRMQQFAAEHGWDAWKEKEPVDQRRHMLPGILDRLRTANKEGTVAEFRKLFPPSYEPLVPHLEHNGNHIRNICAIGSDLVAYIVGTASEGGCRTFIFGPGEPQLISKEIKSMGGSLRGRIHARSIEQRIQVLEDWNGRMLREFLLDDTTGSDVEEIHPFNSGKAVVALTATGVHLMDDSGSRRIHRPSSIVEEDAGPFDMGHVALDPDNRFIAAGDQDSSHMVYNVLGEVVADIGQVSSYPHYALFSSNGDQVVFNSCHFYNGETIGVDTAQLPGLKIDPFSEDSRYVHVDREMRVYAAVAYSKGYIFGDAHGYLRARGKDGTRLWDYYLGSTITGLALSTDERTLWVGAYSGILHKLLLDKGRRDEHVIGTGNHYEEVRVIHWPSDEEALLW